jgi:hypothetical protein
MSDAKNRQPQTNNTITRELFVSVETDEPLTEHMMDIEERDESEREEASPGDSTEE